jgi:hypothetical protein
MIDKQWLHTLSRQLQVVYGRGFSAKNLRHMIRFAEVFADEDIVSTLWRQLSWSHFKEIIYQQAKKTFENRLELTAGKEDDGPTH